MKKDFTTERLKNMKVKDKMTRSFLVMIVMIIFSAIISVIGLNVIAGRMRIFYTTAYQNVELVNQIYAAEQEMGKNMMQACLETKAEDTELRLNQAQECLNDVQRLTNQLLQTSFAETKDLEEILSNAKTVESLFDEFSKQCESNDITKAFSIYKNDMLDSLASIMSSIDEIKEEEAEAAARLYRIANSVRFACIVVTIILCICCVWVGLTISRVLSELIGNAIRELKDAAIKMAEGNFDTKITYDGKDELGELAEAMTYTMQTTRMILSDTGEALGSMAEGNFAFESKIKDRYVGLYEGLKDSTGKLIHRLGDTLQSISVASNQVNIGASQLAQNAQSLAEGATEQAGAVEELTATLENISSMAINTAKNSEEAAEQVGSVAAEAAQGKEEITHLIDAMEKISKTSKEIENIIVDIEDIASQTNLLSLNASIEAARAGEAGKGFAVVADQIGKLASDSAQSAINTRDLIAKSLAEIENGNQITEKTAQVLEKVLNSMDFVLQVTKDSNTNSQTQANMLQDVEKGIEQISSVVQANSAAAEENSATSEELTSQSESMNNMIMQFTFKK